MEPVLEIFHDGGATLLGIGDRFSWFALYREIMCRFPSLDDVLESIRNLGQEVGIGRSPGRLEEEVATE